MTKRKFFKTVFQVTVLSEEKLVGPFGLDYLAEEVKEGEWSGEMKMLIHKEINGKQAAKALLAQGSEPEFFQIDENGNDLEDE